MTRRGCANYAAAMAALIGVCLLAGAAYLYANLGHHSATRTTTTIGNIEVSDSVAPATWAPYGNIIEPSRTPATPNAWPPPDPGGPRPVCWDHPGQGLAPGATCPPKPPGR